MDKDGTIIGFDQHKVLRGEMDRGAVLKSASNVIVRDLDFFLGSSLHLETNTFKEEKYGYAPPQGVNHIKNQGESQDACFGNDTLRLNSVEVESNLNTLLDDV